MFQVHIVGALFAFGGGLVYAALSTALSFIVLRKVKAKLHQFWLQLLCVCAGVLCFIAGGGDALLVVVFAALPSPLPSPSLLGTSLFAG